MRLCPARAAELRRHNPPRRARDPAQSAGRERTGLAPPLPAGPGGHGTSEAGDPPTFAKNECKQEEIKGKAGKPWLVEAHERADGTCVGPGPG